MRMVEAKKCTPKVLFMQINDILIKDMIANACKNCSR